MLALEELEEPEAAGADVSLLEAEVSEEGADLEADSDSEAEEDVVSSVLVSTRILRQRRVSEFLSHPSAQAL